MRFVPLKWVLLFLTTVSLLSSSVANNDDLWLRADPLPDNSHLVEQYRQAIQHVVCLSKFPTESTQTPLQHACYELATTFSAVLSREIDIIHLTEEGFDDNASEQKKEGLIVVSATVESGVRTSASELKDESFKIFYSSGRLYLNSFSGRGCLYGAYHFISLIRRLKINNISKLTVESVPKSPLRIWQCWDNLDGTIERGYGGRSLWHFEELPKVRDRYYSYARLLASLGINAISTSNVNSCYDANKILLSSEYIKKSAALASVFAEFGIGTFLTPCYSSPMIDGVGNLETADPLDPSVVKWWKDKALEIDEAFMHAAGVENGHGLRTFGGFLMKADSEGAPGPSTYNRTEPQGAQPLANALLPIDGVLLWRAFSHPGDIEGTSGDQPLMQYQTFTSLDGEWPSNMVLQIKNGPMDFQTHEPVHSLFGNLPKTSLMLEVGVTQEYTGQAVQICHLPAMWKEYLSFDTDCEPNATATTTATLANIVTGRTAQTSHYTNNGFAGVSNFGQDESWTGHPLVAVNSFGFGRLAWDPELSTYDITTEWVQLTWGVGTRKDEEQQQSEEGGEGEGEGEKEWIETLVDMLMNSWESYENTTTPLGLGAVVENCKSNPQYCPHGLGVTGPPRHDHYFSNLTLWQYASKYCDPVTGVCIGNSGYGGGFNATSVEVGNNRSVAYGATYCNKNAIMFASPETTPPRLLLTFHHVPYTWELPSSGSSVLQTIYDTTVSGVKKIESYISIWESLKGIAVSEDDRRYLQVLNRLKLASMDAKNFSSSVIEFFVHITEGNIPLMLDHNI